MADKIQLNNLTGREVMPGFVGKFIHSRNMTLAYWTISAGASLPAHEHVHEQTVNVLDGEFELTVAGRTMHLVRGDVVVLEPHVVHAGRAITDCRILDVFQPVRKDLET